MRGGPIRSQKVLRAARGQPCTLRFLGAGCDGGGETTVPCHIRDRHKGTGIKASDLSMAFGCFNCHRYLDQGRGQAMSREDALCVIRGLQETLQILVDLGVVVVPADPAPRPTEATPRLPKEQRAPLVSANRWPPKGARKFGA